MLVTCVTSSGASHGIINKVAVLVTCVTSSGASPGIINKAAVLVTSVTSSGASIEIINKVAVLVARFTFSGASHSSGKKRGVSMESKVGKIKKVPTAYHYLIKIQY